MTLETAKVKYGLWSCYYFLAPKLGLSAFRQIPAWKDDVDVASEVYKCFNHSIMDSGLFTLMFGSQAGMKSREFLDKWYNLLCEFVLSYNIPSVCVEVDCQKVLGVDQAWKYRVAMRKDLPNNRIINVFHLEDGEDGLRRLIDFSDYIAISVPEWRKYRRGCYKEGVYRTASFIKERRPDLDIHLLGCTEPELLRRCKFCTSSDSTSYLQVIRWGNLCNKRIRDVKDSVFTSCDPDIRTIIARCNERSKHSGSSGMKKWFQALYISTVVYKEQFTRLIGSQE